MIVIDRLTAHQIRGRALVVMSPCCSSLLLTHYRCVCTGRPARSTRHGRSAGSKDLRHARVLLVTCAVAERSFRPRRLHSLNSIPISKSRARRQTPAASSKRPNRSAPESLLSPIRTISAGALPIES
jgi:hypothetical protein